MTGPGRPTCNRCGESITPGARFCMKCGNDVSGIQGAVATAMMPAPEPSADDLLLESLRQATLGDYEILKELGRGGMATVYLAHDIALDRKVAIKVMAPALLLMGEGMSERFKREARTAANLSHPNIIPIYTVKSAGKTLFFVMKFIAGRSLEDIMRDTGPMPVPMVRAVLQQVGSALGYAHRHGIVHRDVKPANVMIDEEGWSVVTDFGIAKVAENRGLTMTGIAVGTPSYMSPEQCAAKDITGKSDQYSLGIMAYEMIAGRQPFSADSAMAIMYAHFHETPPPLREVRPDCPPELATAVERMLAKSPEQRYGSMEEAVSALGGLTLGHDDPMQVQLRGLARKNSTREILKQVPPPPTSPVPPAKTREVADHATTPLPKTRPSAPTTPIPSTRPSDATTPIPASRPSDATTPIPASKEPTPPPPPAVVGVSVSPERGEIFAGETLQLAANAKLSGPKTGPTPFVWHSSDESLATVDAKGLVKAHAAGTVTITATCEGHSATATISLRPAPVQAVHVAPVEPALMVGESLQLHASVKDKLGHTVTGRTIRWSVSPRGLLEVSASGEVTAQKEGVAEVFAEVEGVKGSTRANIRKPAVVSVTIAPSEARVTAGETLALKAEVKDERGQVAERAVTWKSSNEKIATVSGAGVVSGIAEGKAEIIAECEGRRMTAPVTVAAAPVATVSLEAPAPVMAGEKVTLAAVLKDAQGHVLTGRALKWSSSSPAVATVTQAGQLTGITAGTAKISAESEGKSASVSVTVTPVPVASVAIEGVPKELETGKTATLKAVVKDGKGHVLGDRQAAWSVSPAGVAEVSAKGVLSAKGPGSATVTLTVDGKTAEAKVVVPAPPAPVVAPVVAEAPTIVAPPAEKPVVDAGVPTEVIVPPKPPVKEAPKPVEPPVKRPSVPAPVAEEKKKGGSGALIGGVAGVAVLAAVAYFAFGGKKDDIPPAPPAPVVNPAATPVASVQLAGGSAPVAVGRTEQLSALVKGAAGEELAGKGVTWTSSDPTVAEVSPIGAVTAKKTGSVTITAESEGKRGSVTLEVVAPAAAVDQPAAVASVAVGGPSSHALDVGQTVQLDASLKDAKGATLGDRAVVWTSSDPGVVLVSSTGLVTAMAAGDARVTANSEGKSADVRVTVRAPKVEPAPAPTPPPAPVVVAVASVTVAPSSASVVEGSTVALTATAFDGSRKALVDRALSWSSSDSKVATVNGEGLVTGVSAGSATITASAEGKSATVRLTVTEPPPSSVPVAAVSITAPDKSLKPGEKTTWAAVAKDNRGRDLGDRGGNWSSSDPRVARVDANGVITAVGPGTAEISVTVEGKKVSERFTVTAPPPVVVNPPPPANNPPPPPVTNPPAGPTTPTGAASALLPKKAVEAGGAFSCGVGSSGAVCWGAGLGLTAVDGTAGVTGLTVGRGHACGLVNGRALCWGDNRNGQLGDGGTTAATSPVEVAGGLGFSQLAAGDGFTCGLAGGKAYCWGRNKDGQLGDGSTSDRKRPVAVKGGQSFVLISTGGSHSCALTAAGKAYCWGDGYSGQLGFGAQDTQTEPIDVSGNQKFTRIAAGGKHTCALTDAGKAFCWGSNEAGQVGDGSKSDRSSPVAVAGTASFTNITTGGAHTCARTGGGDVYCWGQNGAGQLGDGTKQDRNKPTPVSGGPFASISAGEAHTCGMTRGGEAQCWGRNDKMQLGDGGTAPRGTPAPVSDRR